MSLQSDFEQSDKPQNDNTLTVRFSTAADAPKVIDFYYNTRHQHVDKRPDSLLRERTEKGQVLLVLDSKGELKASSIAYDFNRAAQPETDFPGVWVEIGSTRSTLSGVGLYPFIVASQVMERFFAHPPQEKFIAAIFKDNQPVTDFLHKVVGWSPFTPDKECADAADLTKELHKVNCLEANSTSLPHQARIVLDFIERGTNEGLLNKKTGERVKFDLSGFTLAHFWRPVLEELAHGAFGKMLESTAPMPLGKARQLLDEYLSAKVFAPTKPSL